MNLLNGVYSYLITTHPPTAALRRTLCVGAADDLPGAEPPPPVRRHACGGRFHALPPWAALPLPRVAAASGLQPRPLYVYLPPAYDAAPLGSLPILVAFDGAELWSTTREERPPWGGWWLDACVDGLWARGEAAPFILVGVPSAGANRARECAGLGFSQWAAPPPPEGGGADPAANPETGDPAIAHLVHTVLPSVRRAFPRASTHRAAALGASLGGLLAWRAAALAPASFCAAAALSGSFWFKDAQGVSAELDAAQRKAAGALHSSTRVYLDSGDGPGDNAGAVLKLALCLERLGWEDRGRDLGGGSGGDEPWSCASCSILNDPRAPLCTCCEKGNRPRLAPGGGGGGGGSSGGWACAACTMRHSEWARECVACGGQVAEGEGEGSMLYVLDKRSPMAGQNGDTHQQAAWAHRVHRAVRFLFPPRS